MLVQNNILSKPPKRLSHVNRKLSAKYLVRSKENSIKIGVTIYVTGFAYVYGNKKNAKS
jgi:hypothetical protein